MYTFWGRSLALSAKSVGFKHVERPLKLFRKTKEIGDKQKLQDDIDELVWWSEKWQM